jgi:hypothetical protein
MVEKYSNAVLGRGGVFSILDLEFLRHLRTLPELLLYPLWKDHLKGFRLSHQRTLADA